MRFSNFSFSQTLAGVLIACFLLLWHVPAAQANATELITKAFSGPTIRDWTNGSSSTPDVSGNGQYVVYVSSASDLVEDDPDVSRRYTDIFLTDTLTGENVLITPFSNGNSRSPSVSNDGRYVAFSSFASNLVTGDPDFYEQYEDVFFLDRETDAVTLISRGGEGYSRNPDISDDGRYVVFTSTAQNLIGDEPDGSEDIFLWDRDSGETISLTSQGTGGQSQYSDGATKLSGNGKYVVFTSRRSLTVDGAADAPFSLKMYLYNIETTETVLLVDSGVSNPSISPDGRYIAFASSSDLAGGAVGYAKKIYRLDADSGEIQLVVSGNHDSDNPKISNDGNYISFISRATDIADSPRSLSPNDPGLPRYYIYSHLTGEISHISSLGGYFFQAEETSISNDGSTVAFMNVGWQIDNNAPLEDITDIFLWQADSGEISKVSNTPEGYQVEVSAGNSDSSQPSVSADGKLVAFSSFATNLISGTDSSRVSYSDPIQDVFVYNRETGSTKILTPFADANSHSPVISEDGRYVFFLSSAMNLTEPPLNDYYEHIYVADLLNDTVEILIEGPNGESQRPSVSADARYLAFSTSASDFVVNDNDYYNDIVFFDRATDEYELITLGGNGDSINPQLSADGKYLAFLSDATNLVEDPPGEESGYRKVFVYNTEDKTTRQLPIPDNTYSGGLTISDNGQYVAFIGYINSGAFSFFRTRAVAIYDLQSDTLEYLDEPGLEVHGSSDLRISSDGRYVVFVDAENDSLVLVDREEEAVSARTLVNAIFGYDDIGAIDITADGRFVAFDSLSLMLSPIFDGHRDVYFLETGVGESDPGDPNDPGDPPGSEALLTVQLNNGSAEKPGPQLEPGAALNWSYFVYNNQGERLNNVEVRVRRKLPELGSWETICSTAALAPDESLDCVVSGAAVEGRFKSLVVVRAVNDDGTPVQAQYDAFYQGAGSAPPTEPGAMSLAVSVNALDTSKPGPEVAAGEQLMWEYHVTNEGGSALENIVIRGRQKLPELGAWQELCTIASIAPGTTQSCSTSTTAVQGVYKSLIVATAPDSGGAVSDALFDAFYMGGEGGSVADPVAALTLSATVNGLSSLKPGPEISTGSNTAWQYTLENSGNLALNDVVLYVRRKLPSLGSWGEVCSFARLEPNAMETCNTNNGAVQPGVFKSLVVLRARTDDGEEVEVLLDAFYRGN